MTGQSVPVGTLIPNSCGNQGAGKESCYSIYAAVPADAAPADVARRAQSMGKKLKAYGEPGSPPYSVDDLRTAYSINIPSITSGYGQNVWIVDAYDDPNAETDLAVYRNAYNEPPCTTANGCFHKYSQTGTSVYPAPDAGWAGEIALDLDMVSAICPLCHINLVEANDNGSRNLYYSAYLAASGHPPAVSMSFGHTETINDVYSNANDWFTPDRHSATTVFTASTGDHGFLVGYPAASPFVVAVGGTTLTRDTSSRLFHESAWGYPDSQSPTNYSGAGAGCSQYQNKPAWQTDSGCPYGRFIADVSAVADPNTGMWVYNTYQVAGSGWGEVGGTSASAPIIAAMFALAGNSATVAAGMGYPISTPNYIYTHTGSFTDVTTGNDCNGMTPPYLYFCAGTVGQDGPTGWGTPNGLGGL